METFAGFAVAAAIVQKLVEVFRKAIPVEGAAVNLVAYVLGGALAIGVPDLRLLTELIGYPAQEWVDVIFTGAALASGAGFLADVTNRSDPDTSVPERPPHDLGNV